MFKPSFTVLAKPNGELECLYVGTDPTKAIEAEQSALKRTEFVGGKVAVYRNPMPFRSVKSILPIVEKQSVPQAENIDAGPKEKPAKRKAKDNE